MNRPSQDDLLAALAQQRMTMASSRIGRLKLRMYMLWKFNAWRITVGSLAIIKRCMDVVISIVVILMISPLMLTLALLIRMDGGPALFKQKRVGKRGKLFSMYKFRSMRVDAEKEIESLMHLNEKGGVTFKLRNDPRITRIGRFIRKTSLDELPQFFNVLRGDMSLVGPRPQLPREVAQYSSNDHLRLNALPGLTCLWQIGEREGKLLEIYDRNKIDFPEQVRLDLRYIESQSIRKDILILLKTIPTILLGKGGA